MQSYQIVAGFSDIKSELRIKTSPFKNLDGLQLWFSFEAGVIFAHDHREHKKCIALAIYNDAENTWQITFRGGTYGKQLIQHVVSRFEKQELADKFRDLYRSHGYITFR